MSHIDFTELEHKVTAAGDDDSKLEAIQAFDEAFQKAVTFNEEQSKAAAKLEAEVAALEAEWAHLQSQDSLTEQATPSAPLPNLADYYDFLTLRSDAIGDFTVLEAAIRGVAEGE
eukprot:PhF_6_TR13137/c0_g1_i1/m.20749